MVVTGEMLTFDPPRLLEYTWDNERLRFELRDMDGGCELTFLAQIREVGKAARDSAGWHVCLDRLALHLDGEPVPDDSMSAWRPLNAEYRRLFGPEASTIGPPDWHPESKQ